MKFEFTGVLSSEQIIITIESCVSKESYLVGIFREVCGVDPLTICCADEVLKIFFSCRFYGDAFTHTGVANSLTSVLIAITTINALLP